MKYDWERIIKDRVPCLVWSKGSDKNIRILDRVYEGGFEALEFFRDGKAMVTLYTYCEPYSKDDKRKYVYELERSDFENITQDHIKFIKRHYRRELWCPLCPFSIKTLDVPLCNKLGLSCISTLEMFSQQFLDLFEKDFEPKYRPCETWEEIKPFWGKTIKKKDAEEYSIIDDYSKFSDGDMYFTRYELIEPIEGSKVIGVKV